MGKLNSIIHGLSHDAAVRSIKLLHLTHFALPVYNYLSGRSHWAERAVPRLIQLYRLDRGARGLRDVLQSCSLDEQLMQGTWPSGRQSTPPVSTCSILTQYHNPPLQPIQPHPTPPHSVNLDPGLCDYPKGVTRESF